MPAYSGLSICMCMCMHACVYAYFFVRVCVCVFIFVHVDAQRHQPDLKAIPHQKEIWSLLLNNTHTKAQCVSFSIFSDVSNNLLAPQAQLLGRKIF